MADIHDGFGSLSSMECDPSSALLATLLLFHDQNIAARLVKGERPGQGQRIGWYAPRPVRSFLPDRSYIRGWSSLDGGCNHPDGSF